MTLGARMLYKKSILGVVVFLMMFLLRELFAYGLVPGNTSFPDNIKSTLLPLHDNEVFDDSNDHEPLHVHESINDEALHDNNDNRHWHDNNRNEYCYDVNGMCILLEGELDDFDDNGLCVLVRTYSAQEDQLTTQLQAWRTIAHSATRDIHIFLMDTDPEEENDEALELFRRVLPSKTKPRTNRIASDNPMKEPKVHFVLRPPNMVPDIDMYGYDCTELLAKTVQFKFGNQCQSYLFTNGDNYYHPLLLKNTGLDGSEPRPYTPMIAVDFITRYKQAVHLPELVPLKKKKDEQRPPGYPARKHKHKRKRKRRRKRKIIRKHETVLIPNQPKQTLFLAGFVDIGSVIVDRQALIDCPSATFTPEETDGKNQFIDFYFFDELVEVCKQEHRFVRQTLFVHQ